MARHVLGAMWMLRLLGEHHAKPEVLCSAFGLKMTKPLRQVAEAVLTKNYKTHVLSIGVDSKVHAKDISSLDAGDDDEEISGWVASRG
jgi:hypothetical protein